MREKVNFGSETLAILNEMEIIQRINSERVSNLLNDKNRVIACDVDEVIAPIALKWISRCHEEGIVRNDITLDELINRKEYYLQKAFHMTDEERYNAIYDDKFYDDLPITTFGKILQLFSSRQNARIVFITHTIERTRASKDEWMKRHFPKCPVIHLESGESKAKAINEHIPDYSTFIDDRLDIVIDVLANTRSLHKEFILPAFGYNDYSEKYAKPIAYAVENNLASFYRFEHIY